MSTARSVFTEVIEDHLSLKKTNATLEATMPLARYDVGDPLDRYPGGPNRAADGTVVVTDAPEGALESEFAMDPAPAEATQLLVGPSPEQAMEAATALEPAFADRPFEPLTGMTPMLSLVEDIEDEDDVETPAAPFAEAPSGDVLRFPGGVGPREDASAIEPAQGSFDTQSISIVDQVIASSDTATIVHDAPTGEQPVLVIDTDEPLATTDFAEPAAPSRSSRTKPRFFGLGRKKSKDDAADGWFTDGPRDFNWD
jgi:hypothetical protein